VGCAAEGCTSGSLRACRQQPHPVSWQRVCWRLGQPLRWGVCVGVIMQLPCLSSSNVCWRLVLQQLRRPLCLWAGWHDPMSAQRQGLLWALEGIDVCVWSPDSGGSQRQLPQQVASCALLFCSCASPYLCSVLPWGTRRLTCQAYLLLGCWCRDCWCVAIGNSYNDQERCVLAGYDNGDVKMFDLRTGTVRRRVWGPVEPGRASARVSTLH
jgi:hypothetical protein